MSNHAHEYVGRHRKPDKDVLRKTLDLFTHPSPTSLTTEEPTKEGEK